MRRLPFLLLAAVAVSACSEIDCAAPQRYHGAKLAAPLKAPEGLQPVDVTDDHQIPGGEAPAH